MKQPPSSLAACVTRILRHIKQSPRRLYVSWPPGRCGYNDIYVFAPREREKIHISPAPRRWWRRFNWYIHVHLAEWSGRRIPTRPGLEMSVACMGGPSETTLHALVPGRALEVPCIGAGKAICLPRHSSQPPGQQRTSSSSWPTGRQRRSCKYETDQSARGGPVALHIAHADQAPARQRPEGCHARWVRCNSTGPMILAGAHPFARPIFRPSAEASHRQRQKTRSGLADGSAVFLFLFSPSSRQ